MLESSRDDTSLIQVSSVDEQQRNPQAILQTSASTISCEGINLPRNILDVLDGIYSSRAHRRCMDLSYCTLLSMTLAVIFWVSYWLTYNRCQNLKDPQSNTSLCNVVIVFEVFIYISSCISPILFIIMIYFWIQYSCYNPLDSIRENYFELKLEGNRWKQQLDYYFYQYNTKYLNCCYRKQVNELNNRGYGYIILSRHGIVLDELIVLSARTDIIDNGIILHHEKILKLTFKKTCRRPWKISLSICLPENYVEQGYKEKLIQLLKIQINVDDTRSLRH
ncbi:unnamed protein product [Rotaria sp. Silwood2]|nr:unnamed protein product [Rotaria sp. Silwood2]CAF2653478.1 unnamed protein product [Rotaria sp. Silwood2]CAF2726868.1 unnamed protein product [Rotaria sp. Silwood2]CAF3064588.1 unnamed protein product [Rotaria sp. Silwood2]CAF4033482.1 unnamed protein product [Rotaria sp. Silwood2]